MLINPGQQVPANYSAEGVIEPQGGLLRKKKAQSNVHKTQGTQGGSSGERVIEPQGGSSQAGVLKQKKPQANLDKTPHGIKPQSVNSKNKVTITTRENVEARRREMQAKLRQNPVWKI